MKERCLNCKKIVNNPCMMFCSLKCHNIHLEKNLSIVEKAKRYDKIQKLDVDRFVGMSSSDLPEVKKLRDILGR